MPHTLLHSIPPPPVGAQTQAGLGASVAVEGNYTVTGVTFDDTGATDSGVVKVFHSVTSPLLFVILNPSPAEHDLFGAAVASSGTRVVVGAYNDDSGATNAGSAYDYDLTSATTTVLLDNATTLKVRGTTPSSPPQALPAGEGDDCSLVQQQSAGTLFDRGDSGISTGGVGA